LAAALTAAALALAFPPAEVSALAWIALVPLLLALSRIGRRRDWLLVWLAGWAFGIAGFFWARHVTVLGLMLLGLYISFYVVLFAGGTRWLMRRGMPFAFAAPLVWTALEVVRGVLFTGLPMLLLAHTQYRWLRAIQIADLAGTAGVTFWIVMVNGLLADAVLYFARRPCERTLRVLAGAVVVVLLSTFALVYGHHRLTTIVTRRGPRIAVVQGNIPQDVKNRLTEKDVSDMFATHMELTRKALKGKPDLIIWPETMAPYGLFDPDYEAKCWQYVERLRTIDKSDRQLVERLGNTPRWRGALYDHQNESAFLIGVGSYSVTDGVFQRYNSVRFLPRGKRGPTTRYDKIHLVPFGEYVPLKPLIGWAVGPLIPYEEGLTPGAERTLFEIDGWHFAPTICFEDLFPREVADFARGETKVDFIVNVTNEGWFKDGAELDQHIAIAAFRAIECRAGFVRAANTGISAFISPTGRVLSTLSDQHGRDREIAGVLIERVTGTDVRSPYLFVGESFGGACVAGCILSMLLTDLWRRRSRAGRDSSS